MKMSKFFDPNEDGYGAGAGNDFTECYPQEIIPINL